MTTTPIVHTSAGPVRGRSHEGIATFKGIPYAASTEGANRFLPPQRREPWTEPLDAGRYGPSCPQMVGEDRSWFAKVLGATARAPESYVDEDCLVLNVWTPAPDDGRRPVMVWLHGGAFLTGSGSQSAFDGTQLARNENVVVVTVNHRLGILGYLDLSDSGDPELRASGNAGLLDLVEALRWVRNDIGRFGGDPGNVTIFGVSGGGLKVSALLTMPCARGLFHRAAIQSGPGLRFERPEQAAQRTADILQVLDLARLDPEALRRLPVERLIEAQTTLVHRAGGRPATSGEFGFSPHIDGTVIPMQPIDALVGGETADVPVITGCTRDEFRRLLPSLDPLSPGELDARIDARVGDGAADVVGTYVAEEPGASDLDHWVRILSDQVFRLPTLKLAEHLAATGRSTVYVYLLTWPSPAMNGAAKALHSMCSTLIFGNTDRDPVTAHAAESVAVSRVMQRAWATFARVGDPSTDDLRWEPYTVPRRPTMVFDATAHLVDDPFGAQRDAWSGLVTGEDIYA